jgi:hypothetical protein
VAVMLDPRSVAERLLGAVTVLKRPGDLIEAAKEDGESELNF